MLGFESELLELFVPYLHFLNTTVGFLFVFTISILILISSASDPDAHIYFPTISESSENIFNISRFFSSI